MPLLSAKARRHKIEYNIRRNRELYSQFNVRLPKEEYNDLCEFLKSVGLNKTEFIRWSYDKLREQNR